MAKSNILTGQYVHISQTPASVGERMLAQLIDWVIQAVYAGGMLWLFITYLARLISEDLAIVIVIFLILLPALFYGFLMELFMGGQTFGKKVLKLRVVKADGSIPGIGAYLLRWMFMIVDGPTLSGLGVLVMLLSKNTQRLGDLAAGTMVIKQDSYKRLQVSLDEFAPFSRNYRPVYPQAENLSLEQVNLIDQTLRLKEDDQRIHTLAEQVKLTLGITEVRDSDDPTFLWHVKRDYQYYALEGI